MVKVAAFKISTLSDLVASHEAIEKSNEALHEKETQLISSINDELVKLGYKVVPLGLPAEPAPIAGVVSTKTPAPARMRGGTGKLSCPHCARTFGHPAHLGRHVSASHGAAKNGNGGRRSRK